MSNSFSRILFIAKRECRRLIAKPVYVLGMVVFPILVTVLFTSLMDEGQPEEMPVGVVDLDNTSFTRKLTRSLDAFQTTHIVARYPNVEEARKAMQQGTIYASSIILKEPPMRCCRHVSPPSRSIIHTPRLRRAHCSFATSKLFLRWGRRR